MKENETLSEYRGSSLFNDIEDATLRNHNRGAILANMVEDGMNGSKIKHSATADVIGYFANIPEEDRKDSLDAMEAQLKERNIKVMDVDGSQ
jgi:hypothetical protein